MPSRDVLDRDFKLIEAAAAAGERCPQSAPHGPLHSESSSSLARAGRIRVEIFAHNWRVATVMEGPHKGKQTLRPPYKHAVRPYKVIYRDHVTLDTLMSRRQSGAKPTLAKLNLPPLIND